jgi:hypothetical protein
MYLCDLDLRPLFLPYTTGKAGRGVPPRVRGDVLLQVGVTALRTHANVVLLNPWSHGLAAVFLVSTRINACIPQTGHQNFSLGPKAVIPFPAVHKQILLVTRNERKNGCDIKVRKIQTAKNEFPTKRKSATRGRKITQARSAPKIIGANADKGP